MTSPIDRYLPRVQVSAAGLENLVHLDAPVLLAANHASRLDRGFVLRATPAHLHASPLRASVALRLRRSPVVFPEHGTSPDGSLGHFHGDDLVVAAAHGCRVVPVAIRGSVGLDAEPSRWRNDTTPTVYVRFGAPLVQPSPDELRETIAALLREDSTTWWSALTTGADDADSGTAVERAASGGSTSNGAVLGSPATNNTASESGWLAAWNGLAPAQRPGENRRPTIWG